MTRILTFLLAALTVAGYGSEMWEVVRVEEEPILDGRLGDPCWREAVPRVGFVQRDPNPGEASTEKTTIYAIYTDRALYVGFECYDSEASNIVTRLRSRDSSVWPDDNIDIWFDPTGSGIQLYYFSTNPAGVKYDALNTSRGMSSNQQWDAHWDVATGVTNYGWNAEFEIPFANFKFDRRGEKPWLFNAGRVIRRKGEETYTVSVPYEHNMFYLEDAVRLTGIKNIAAGVGIKVVPYTKTDHRWLPAGSQEVFRTDRTNAGVDVDVDIGSSLTLATTFMPDFAEIDLDPDQYQIGFGQMFVPETRPFFLRDSNYFRTISFSPFYSRRIGKRLYSEEGIYQDAEITTGARLTGKTGPVSIGGFYAHTKEALWEPESDWGVARARYDLGPRSFVGLVGTVRSARSVAYNGGLEPSYGFNSFGLDYEYYFTNDWNTWGMLIGTHDSRFDENRFDKQYGQSAGMAWRKGTFEVWANYQDLAEEFSTDETGFVSWSNHRTVEGGVGKRLGFGNAMLRNLGVNVYAQQSRPRDWSRGFEKYELTLDTQTNFNWMFSLSGAYGVDNLMYNPGEPDGFAYGRLGIRTDPSAALSVHNSVQVGAMPDYTTGSRGTIAHDRVEVAYAVAPELLINAVFEYNKWWMASGEKADNYDVAIWRGDIEYLHSRELFLRLFGQGSTQNDIYTFRALVGWEFRPDSNIHVAYEQMRDDSAGSFELSDHGIFLKVDHFFHL